MTPIVGAGLSLATEVLKFINSKEATKYIDRAVKLQLEIEEEESKGYASDDPKLESLYREAAIIQDAARAQLQMYVQQKAGV